MQLTRQQVAIFQDEVWGYYAKHGREALPWRQSETDLTFDPYKIMVSELMLQQTQVARVIPKYEAFLEQFPTAFDLSTASIGEVLRAWQGLGYNRRAKFLWQSANSVVALGSFPSTIDALVQLPGVGKNTAGAIMAYAYNQPVIFIETNIRTVYIHHFLTDQTAIEDSTLLELVKQTVNQENAREWYWAIMDYGSYLKANIGNVNRASKHFAVQSKFQGSRRQIRGQVIRWLGDGALTEAQLSDRSGDERLAAVLQELVDEHLITLKAGQYRLD